MLGFNPLASAPLADDGGVDNLVDNLTGAGITTSQPAVGASDLEQDHDLALDPITIGQPTVGSADIAQLLLAAASASASAAVEASAVRVCFGQSQVSAILTASTSPLATYAVAPAIDCAATVAANVNRVASSSASTAISAIIAAGAQVKWSIQPDTPETWTQQADAGGDWTEQADTPENWTQVA